MNIFRLILKLDSTIESLLSDRRALASKSPNCPDIVETSKAPEFRELRAYRKRFGDLPGWAQNPDSVDMDIIKPLGPEERKHAVAAAKIATRWRLQDGFAAKRARNKQRTSYARLAASVVLCMVLVSGGMVGSLGGWDTEQTGVTASGAKVFENKFSGDQFGASAGDSISALLVSEASAANQDEVLIIRWQLAGGEDWSKRYFSTKDSVLIEESFEWCPGQLSPELTDFLISGDSWRLEKQILKSGIIPFGNEEVIINGASVNFDKWEIRTPRGMVEYWRGITTHPRSPEH